jgi:septal ring factor EnvC (AmiA/AmiB activator)
MKTQLSAIALLALYAGAACAQGEVYVCMNDRGTKEYKNTGITKGCKRVDLQGVTMIPSGNSGPRPVVQTVAARSPSSFPKVDSGTQKARDNDRMQILQDEMKAEEKKLADMKKEFNNGEPERNGNERNYAKYQERVAEMKDNIARTEKNVEALKREISNLK